MRVCVIRDNTIPTIAGRLSVLPCVVHTHTDTHKHTATLTYVFKYNFCLSAASPAAAPPAAPAAPAAAGQLQRQQYAGPGHAHIP